jgi:hypothetical protein
MTEAAKLSAKDLADQLKTDPKTLRRFLRKQGMGVGQGGRYEFEKADVTKLRKPFQDWLKSEADRKAKAAAEKSAKSDPEPTPADEGDSDDEKSEPVEQRQADVVDKAIAEGTLPSGKVKRTRSRRAGKTTAAA